MFRRLPLFAALLGAAPAVFAAAEPGVEAAAFFAPSLGREFDGHTGGGVSLALTATYDLPDSRYGEQLLGQVEGVYLHTSGTNSVGGPSHRETFDAGFALLNLGLGARCDDFSFALFAGLGAGTGKITGDTASKDLALEYALQIKPRVCWHFARGWAVFAEYRHLRTASMSGHFFSTDDPRALALNGVGLGVTHTF